MDYHSNARRIINLPIMIYHNSTGFIGALIKDAGIQELLVDIGQVTLPTGAVVELAGMGSWQLESKNGLPKALVMRAGKGDEMALMLL